jgi:uncharacterized membrane protein
VFGDLHAHVIALPLFLLVAAASLQLVRTQATDSGEKERLGSAALLGSAFAVQALTNAWDVPLLLALLVAITIARAAVIPLRHACAGAAVTLLTAFAVGRPLWVRGGGAPGIGWSVERGASGVDVFTVFGLFFAILALWAWVFISGGEASPVTKTAFPAIAILAFAVTFFISVEIACVIGALFFVFVARRSSLDAEERLAAAFAAVGFILVLVPQRIYVEDRTTTFFKLYLEAWLVFALGGAVLVLGRRFSWRHVHPAARLAICVFGAASAFTSVTATWGSLTPPGPPRSAPLTLHGMEQLKISYPSEAQAVLWLWRSVSGTPVVLEAQGMHLRFGRISMMTGLPTVLAWERHVALRAYPRAEIDARKAAVAQIYSSPDARAVMPLLRRYDVSYVYVGWLEKWIYPAGGLQKFADAKDSFEPAYDNGETTIYRVKP